MTQQSWNSAWRKSAWDPRTHLDRNATFDTFVPGDSNRFARTIALAVAEGASKVFNPLYIYGGPGLGKTHLLNAIGNYALVKDPSLKVRYITAEEFTNEFIDALQDQSHGPGRVAGFNRRYREVDVLLIDDIQFLSGKEATLEQFFHTFNALHQAGRRIVVAADTSPKHLKDFDARLISRFYSGLTTEIKPLDVDTHIAILRMISSESSVTVPDSVLKLLSNSFAGGLRESEEALKRIIVTADLNGKPVTLAFAERSLRDMGLKGAEDQTPHCGLQKASVAGISGEPADNGKTVPVRSASPLFCGYANVRLDYRELCSIINDEAWRVALGGVQGVYLLTDRSNGWHYVGSAHSDNGGGRGLLSCWARYAHGDHTGGNMLLKAIPNAKNHIERYFQYSILDVFDMKTDASTIIEREFWWMRTLSSVRSGDDPRPHGYN